MSAFTLISSALRPGTDLLDGAAEGPNLTHRRPTGDGVRRLEVYQFSVFSVRPNLA